MRSNVLPTGLSSLWNGKHCLSKTAALPLCNSVTLGREFSSELSTCTISPVNSVAGHKARICNEVGTVHLAIWCPVLMDEPQMFLDWWHVACGKANRLPQVSRPVSSCIHNTRHRHSALNEQDNVSTITCGQLQNIYESTKEGTCFLQWGLMMATDGEDTIESSSRKSMLGYFALLHRFIQRVLCDTALYVEDGVGKW